MAVMPDTERYKTTVRRLNPRLNKERNRRGLTARNRVNLHIAAVDDFEDFDDFKKPGKELDLFNFFNQDGKPDCHVYVQRDGDRVQYVPFEKQAYADLEGNDGGWSIETEGTDGPWTKDQVASIVEVILHLHKKYGSPRLKLATSSRVHSKESEGISWHRLGIDGNFPTGNIYAGRLQRMAPGVPESQYMHYSKSRGKACPTDKCIEQIPQILTFCLQGGVPDDWFGKKEPAKKPEKKPEPEQAKDDPKKPPAKKPKTTGKSGRQKIRVDGKWGSDTTTQLQIELGTPVDGIVSRQQELWESLMDGCTTGWEWEEDPDRGSALIVEMQARMKAAGLYDDEIDGWLGPIMARGLEKDAGIKRTTGRLKAGGAAVRKIQTTLNRRFAGEKRQKGEWL